MYVQLGICVTFDGNYRPASFAEYRPKPYWAPICGWTTYSYSKVNCDERGALVFLLTRFGSKLIFLGQQTPGLEKDHRQGSQFQLSPSRRDGGSIGFYTRS